jgi:iron complex outermembrane receptor protein
MGNSRVIVCAAALACQTAWAQFAVEEEDLALAYGDKQFVSIATGTRQAIRKAPSTATVITAEDIAAMGARTVSEALEAVPGLHVARDALQSNYAPTYGVRGILTSASPQILMMVNGVPRTSLFLGNPDPVRVELPVENISRIEVIRGPGSAVYGADAFAGTINIITKTAAEQAGTRVALGGGSFGTWESWVQHGSKHGDLEFAGYLKVGTSEGQRRHIAADAQSAFDAVLGTSASRAPGPVNLGYDSLDAQGDIGYGRLRLRAGYTLRSGIESGAGIAAALDPAGQIRSERVTGEIAWSDANFGRDLTLDLQAAFLQMGITTTRPLRVFPAGADFTLIGGSAFPNGMLGAPDKWERHTRLSAASVYSGFSDHRLRFGLGHDLLELYRTAESKNFTLLLGPPTALAGGFGPASGANLYLSPHSRRVNYLYLQDEWSFAREWTLTAGVRHDRYSDFGGTTNPRVALVWEARPDLTAKLLYGSAFRAPSFVELYAAANPVALGNPQLQPEKIRTVEASLTWQPSPAIQTPLSLFRHEISDLIRQNATTYVNAGRQRGHGGEWEFAWIPGSRLRLSGHYAYQKNIDETTHRDAGLAPHHHAYARADWQFAGDWALGAQANWVADRQRTPGDNRDRIPDYTTLDLTLRSTRAWSGWDVSATIRNLFNADVREPSLLNPALPNFGIVDDFPMPRRTFWIQGRYAL